MSNHYNEMLLENKFQEAIDMGLNDVQAEKFAWAFFNEEEFEFECDSNADIDIENGQCICSKYNCEDEYSHWTSGF
jgi:hypothetical protein